MANSILIIEDDEMLADNIRVHLQRNQWETHVAHSAEEGLKKLEAIRPDILLTDHMFRAKTGLDVIKEALAMDPGLKIVMLTGEGSVQIAVDAMKAGACEYLAKPISLAELKMVLDKVLGRSQMEKTLSVLQRQQSRGSLDAIIGESPPMIAAKTKARQMLEAEKRMNDSDLPAILITGETGTGKELLARAMHFEGVRKDFPFIEINCASLPPNLLESELFGHERGAFTDAKDRRIGLVEAADGGTLFLDEIGDMPLDSQTRLLRVLDGAETAVNPKTGQRPNVRIIAATNRDLRGLIREGLFREDLFFRLNVAPVRLPPLRERTEDIPELARSFLLRANREGLPAKTIDQAALDRLKTYDWPGNVRELENLIRRICALYGEDMISARIIERELTDHSAQAPGQEGPVTLSTLVERYLQSYFATQADGVPPIGLYDRVLEEVEAPLIRLTLSATRGNQVRAAEILGLNRNTLRKKITDLGVESMRPKR